MAVSLIELVETPGDALLLALMACLATSIVASNMILIAAFVNSRALLKQNNYLYTLSLAVSDFLVGAGFFYNGLYDVKDEFGPAYSPPIVIPVIHGVSLLTLLASMLDRYYAVHSPFKYVEKMTRRKTMLIIGFTWLVPLVTLLMNSNMSSSSKFAYKAYSTTVVSIFLLVVMVVINTRIYITTRRQQSREPGAESKARAAHLVIIASTMFIILWMPSLIGMAICAGFDMCISAPYNAKNPLNTLRILNTLSTPVIFLIGSTLTRASLKELALRLRCKRLLS
uniref:Tyramine receptor Ser-2-like n=1 Tax=Petromyzon marinus TaxID=7757 RepID=A0AAJ7SPN7_PETMA|nr:tyramine receptor Ser-2-like [Petromyzon marinus]